MGMMNEETCISRAYIESIVEELENICINGDDYILSLLSNIKNAPPVTPNTSCKACREQVLKHLEKEDWADTVSCVMNMPFINKPCVSEGVCQEDKIQALDKIRAEIMQLDYDLEDVDYDYNDMTHTETVHMICREEVLQILDKYKAESEE